MSASLGVDADPLSAIVMRAHWSSSSTRGWSESKMRLTFCLTLLLLAGFVQQERPPLPANLAPELHEDADAFSIYAMLLADNYVWKKAGRPVIQQETTGFPRTAKLDDSTCLTLREQYKNDWQDAVDDYLKSNQSPRLLAPKFPTEKAYDLLKSSQISAAFVIEHKKKKVRSWAGFRERYPDSGGYIEFSVVGFNRTKDRAVLYMGHYCGGMCGAGNFYFLVKRDEKWEQVKLDGNLGCFWIS
jgi:hypothetical protein